MFPICLEPVSSSVMDYLTRDDDIALGGIGPYDIAAIRYLYGISDEVPPRPFCTDDAVCRYGEDAEALSAWEHVVATVRTDITTADENRRYGLDSVTRRLIELLYLNDEPGPSAQAVVDGVLTELRATLVDEGHVRTFRTRRTTVDALKTMQTLAAYRVLADVRSLLDAQAAAEPDADRAQRTRDLLERVKAASEPYFQ